MKAVVLYFNRNSGEGMVQGLDDCQGTAMVYACNIPGKKTWYPETACVFYVEGQIIDFEMNDHFVVPVTPGIFDEEKWNSLDHDRLAFKCDENGKATNGLFGKGAGLW